MIHVAIAGTLAVGTAATAAIFPPVGLALGLLGLGMGLIARGDK